MTRTRKRMQIKERKIKKGSNVGTIADVLQLLMMVRNVTSTYEINICFQTEVLIIDSYLTKYF